MFTYCTGILLSAHAFISKRINGVLKNGCTLNNEVQFYLNELKCASFRENVSDFFSSLWWMISPVVDALIKDSFSTGVVWNKCFNNEYALTHRVCLITYQYGISRENGVTVLSFSSLLLPLLRNTIASRTCTCIYL